MYRFEKANLDVKIGSETFNVALLRESYTNNRMAIPAIISDNGEPFAILSVNIPDIMLQENEVIIKNWSENETLAAAAMASGCFVDTGKRIRTGFVEAPIWKALKSA